jgi:cytochrome P450
MSQEVVEVSSLADIFKSLSLDFIQNPYDYYRQMPSNKPLLLRSPGYWITADYNTIEEILQDKRFQRNFGKIKSINSVRKLNWVLSFSHEPLDVNGQSSRS